MASQDSSASSSSIQATTGRFTNGAFTTVPYQICTQCVMDTTDSQITFDEEGVCHYCHRYSERVKNEVFTGPGSKAKFEKILEDIKTAGKGKEYDCIVGVSGGVDSTMVAYHAKQLGLRPLAVHFDNGWNSELAVDNIKKVLETLDIDLFTYVVDWEEFKDIQLSFIKASVPNCEIPTDHAIFATLFRIAKQHGIKNILSGSNIRTEGILPAEWVYLHQDLKHIKAIHKQFGTASMKSFPELGWVKYASSVLLNGIRIIPILNYLDYDKTEAMKVLQDELGWRYYGGKHYESVYTRFFQGYYLPEKFGFDKRKCHFACLINAGEITREEALAELAKETYPQSLQMEDRAFTIKKFGITEADWEGFMKAKPKKHTDHPTETLIYEKLTGLKKWFKSIATKS